MSDTIAPARIAPLASLATLLTWNLNSIGAMLPLIVVIQAVIAAGMIIGFGFLIPNIDQSTALFLATGTPAIMLLLIGFVLVPQGLITARNTGSFTYMRSLPVARPLLLIADLAVWLVVALPGLALACLVAMWRFDISFAINWPVLLTGALLVATMAASVGYAIGVATPPMAALALTQALGFFMMLFSPINFPASTLPQWYQTLHEWLPLAPGANVIRAGLASTTFTLEVRDLLVLGAWTVLCVGISLRVLMARR